MNKYILDTLKDIDAPVAFEQYIGEEPQYVRFFYLPQGQFDSDDDEQYTVHYVQVDIFSPGILPGKPSLKELTSEVKERMKQAGFKKNYENDRFEDDTKLYHKVLRFYIIKEEF